MLLEQLAQDVRYGFRGMSKNRMFTALAALSLALGIGANTAIYSFMDAILLRSLPVADPASLVVVKWRSRPDRTRRTATRFVMHSMDGSTYRDAVGSRSPRSFRFLRSSGFTKRRRRSCPASSHTNRPAA